MIDIKSFDSWREYNGFSEGSGRSEKVWLISDDNTIGLFKFPKVDPSVDEPTTEHVSEHIAHRLGNILNIPTAKVDIGTRDGRIGCISYLAREEDETLIEGITFISGIYPAYDEETLYDASTETYYCLDSIIKSVPGVVPVRVWIEMMVFDFLIGNSDRHHSNWALLAKMSSEDFSIQVRRCPLYDNGSSLCCYVPEKQISKFETKDTKPFEALTDSKSVSMIRIDGKNKNKPRHSDVMRYLLNTYPATEVIIKRVIERLNDNVIDELLGIYQNEILSERKRGLITKYIKRKVRILKTLIEEGVTKTDE